MNITLSNTWLSRLIAALPVLAMMVLVATLLFPFGAMQRWAIYAFVLTYAADYFYHRRYSQWRWKRSMWVSVVSMLLFVWLLVVHLVMDDGPSERFTLLVNSYAPFFVLGLLGLLGLNEQFAMRRIAGVMLLMVVTEGAIVLYHVCGAGSFSSLDGFVTAFFDYRKDHFNTHMLHNLYANAALVLSFVSLICEKMDKWKQWSLIVLMALVGVLIFLTDGRIGSATMLLLIVMMLCYPLWRRSRVLMLALSLVMVTVGVVLMSHHSRVSLDSDRRDPRVYIWPVAVETMLEHPVSGYGPERGRAAFIEKGKENLPFVQHYYSTWIHLHPALKDHPTRMHCHNAFLDIWIDLGLAGMLLLVLLFMLPVLLTRGRLRYAQVMLAIVFVAQCTFDVLGGDIPPMLYMMVEMLLLHGTKYTAPEVSVSAPDHAEFG